MAYDNTGNKYFRCILEAGGDIGCKLFLLDTIDIVGTVQAAGYISDGKAHGVRKGDFVLVRRWTTLPLLETEVTGVVANPILGSTLHIVMALNATTGAPDLGDPLVIPITNT
jgi:hypothetical protein